jgi:HEAT repeat protein
MRRVLILPLAALALVVAGAPSRADDKEAIAADEKRLKELHLASDGPGLVELLKTRAKGEVERKHLEALLKGLEGASLDQRQKAFAELVAIGTPAIPMLRLAARDIDNPSLSGQAKAALRAIEEDPGAVTAAAVRLLGARRPAGAAQALLDFLPHSETDQVVEEMKNVLASLAYEKGKPDPVMMKALSNPHPMRRAAAVTALCAGGIPEPRETFRKLLADPKPSVRLQAALALGRASDQKAVSTLIALLPDLPMEQVKEIEAFLMELAGELAPKAEITEDTLGREKARDLWARWWLDTEGPGLIAELTKRTLSEQELGEISALIEKLGDESFEERESAEIALKKLGAKIIPLLRNARTSPDLEIRNRSQKTLEAIEMDKTPPLSAITVRLMALRKPKGGPEAIIAYMPFADDEGMVEELQTALNVMAYDGGKPNPALLKGLKDAKNPSRRAAAAQALCAGPLTEEVMKLVRLALADKDPVVRAKTALALASAKEPEAVPVLIKLVEEGPVEQSLAAEEYLMKVGRDAGPKDLPDGDENRKKRAAAWSKWWDANKDKAVLVSAKAPFEDGGGRLAVMAVQDNRTGMTKLVVVDAKSEVKHTITAINYPNHASLSGKDRLVVCDPNMGRVCEIDFKGKVLWSKPMGNQQSIHKLRNGQVFVSTRNELIWLDGKQNEVRKITRPGYDIVSARAFEDGTVSVLTQQGNLVRYGRDGKQLSSVTLDAGMGVGGIRRVRFPNGIHALFNRDGSVIVPEYYTSKVRAFGKDGKERWSATVPNPWSVATNPNGGLTVATRSGNTLYELDRNGKEGKRVSVADGIPLFYDRR